MDEERPELDFHFYFGVLRRRAWIIVLVTIIVTGAALARSLSSDKVYQATATVLVQDPNAQVSVDQSSGNSFIDISTEVALVQSGKIAAAAAKAMGADGALVTGLSVGQVGDTTLMSITAESSSPRVAQLAANTYAKQYVKVRKDQKIQATEETIRSLQDHIAELKGQQAALNPLDPSAGVQIASLQSDIDSATQRVSTLQLNESLITQNGATVVDLAGRPSSPIAPDPKRDALLGFALGIVLGLGLAFLYEFLDDKIKTQEDVIRYAHGLTVLAEIPTISKEKKGRRLVALDDPSSGSAEAYRSLRTSLRLLSLRKPIQTLLVTSSMAGEGKTTTSANLGVTLARSGLRVIIVDLDLRRASLAPLFGGDNDIGLMTVLVGETTLAEAMYEVPIAAGVPPLRFLPAGPIPPNPSEIMGTSRMAEVINNLRASADFVIIDSPPIVPVTDAVVLSSRVDAVMLVIQAGKTRRRHLTKSADLLAQADAPMIGAVMNGAGRHARYGYYERYGYGYSKPTKAQSKKYKGSRPGQERRPRMPTPEVPQSEGTGRSIGTNSNGTTGNGTTGNGAGAAQPAPEPTQEQP
ncbi:MAG TPA: polysaccharide biosynthesis tyrosine autokinase [Acidimicrobiia bacterium]|jgi:capsular exopolysaccharide synthesis family protein